MRFLNIFAALLVAGLLAWPAGAATVDKIAAVVNDRIITTHQLDQAVQAQLKERKEPFPSGSELANLRSNLLSRLVEDSLVDQKIQQLGLSVSDQEVETAIRDVQKQNKLTREQLVNALQVQGMDFEVYKAKLRKQILRFKLIGREVQSKVEVTSQQVRDYFREHLDDFRQAPFMRISRITFPVPKAADAKQRAAIRAKAEAARQRLADGEDLATVLKGYAVDGSADGGDMGIFKEGELTPVFDRAIRDLKQGEVSNIVAAPNGDLYLFKVDVRKPGTIRQFDTVKGDIEQILLEQNREKRFQDWVKNLRQEAYIDIRI